MGCLPFVLGSACDAKDAGHARDSPSGGNPPARPSNVGLSRYALRGLSSPRASQPGHFSRISESAPPLK